MKTTREEIINVAGELFRSKGYRATTLTDIADKVGLLKGSLYHHIGSKEELLIEVATPPIRAMVAELRIIIDKEMCALDRLHEAVDNHLSHLHADYPHIFVYLQERFGSDQSELVELSRTYQRLLEELIREGIAAGELRSDVNPRLTVFFILGACNWMHKWYTPGRDVDIETVKRDFAVLFRAGVGANSS